MTTEITKNIYKLCQLNKEVEVIDYVMDKLDDLLTDQNYNFIDIILCEIELEKISHAVMISLLTTTAPFSEFLRTRYDFYTDVQDYLNDKVGNTEASRLLKGLDK